MTRNAKGFTTGYRKSRGLFGLACLSLLGFVAFLGGGARSAGAAADPCPNAEFRDTAAEAQLPSCRAYELVSPPDKNGFDIQAAREQQAALDGDSILYIAEGAFAGAQSNVLPAYYLANRQSPGWSTTALSPPIGPVLGGNNSAVLALSDERSKAIVRSNAALTPNGWTSDAPFFFGAALYLQDLSDGTYQLLTPAPVGSWMNIFGEPTPYKATFYAADKNFNHILFDTVAELTPDADPLDDSQSKVYKWSNGTLTLESILPNGEPTTGSAGTSISADVFNQDGEQKPRGTLSNDGSRVFFTSPPTLGGSPGGTVYVRESGVTTEIGTAIFEGATPDGSYVFFGGARYEVDTGITISMGGSVIGFSDDGSRVYTKNVNQLAIWQSGVSTPIASVSDGAFMTQPTDTAHTQRYVPPSGAGLLFVSRNQLTSYDNSNPDCDTGRCREVYLYQANTDELSCVSCNPSGAPPIGDARVLRGGLQHHLSEDGQLAFFDTRDRLVPADTNNRDDVYMWENGQVHLLSSGRDGSDARFADASASGDDVFFVTRERLVGWDIDDAVDLYDARVGGGLAEPEVGEPDCVADDCQGPSAGLPDFPEQVSTRFRGSGNLASRPSCRHLARRTQRLSRRANRLRRNAARVRNAKRARAMRRKADRLAKQAKRQSANTRSCRRANRGTAR